MENVLHKYILDYFEKCLLQIGQVLLIFKSSWLHPHSCRPFRHNPVEIKVSNFTHCFPLSSVGMRTLRQKITQSLKTLLLPEQPGHRFVALNVLNHVLSLLLTQDLPVLSQNGVIQLVDVSAVNLFRLYNIYIRSYDTLDLRVL